MDQHSLHRGFSCVCANMRMTKCVQDAMLLRLFQHASSEIWVSNLKEQLSCEKKTKGSC